MKKIILNIAKIKIGFAFEEYDEGFFRKLDERYGAFKVDLSLEKFINVKFSKKFFVKDNRVLLNDNGKLTIKRKDFCFDGNILFIRKDIYSFDSFLRVYISDVLNKHNGLLIHSAGVVFNDRGFLFVSKSGGGKSTIAKIFSNEFPILNDEIIPLIFEKNKIYSFSSPFYGEIRSGNKFIFVEVSKVFLIKKSDTNFERDLDLNEKIFKIMRCVLNFNNDKDTISKILNKVIKISKTCVSELNFTKDKNFIEFFKRKYS